MPVSFYSEGISFTLKNKLLIRKWINNTLLKEGKKTGAINFIFCNDEHLLELNKKYLNHNTLTDIITFDYTTTDEKNLKSQCHPELVEGSNLKSAISGDIFISIERIKENSEKFKVPFDHELHRVIIHGILHLAGYKDKTKPAKKIMTAKEDFYLHLLKS